MSGTLERLAKRIAAFDGVAPLNEASLLAIAADDEARVDLRIESAGEVVAAAYAPADAPVEAFVDPRFRRGGLGTRLVLSLRADGERRFWAHGDLPSAQALARATGLRAARTLLILRRERAAPPPDRVPEGITIRSFTDADAEAVVAVNARAFTDHPEQGAMDLTDFRRRTGADWFDPAGLFVAEREGRIVGFHWTKVEDGCGEVYVVGVDPSEHGCGLGTALTARGLRHLDALVPVVDLYVEADNAAALTLYRNLGFTEHARDTLYEATP
ncbi:MAG: mycothiol synthase [Aeromicrobium sp.]|uniref:mycothiol synthase n=1 Tax=Aeromicrobium sp. TaxID=1871063 RepID=UPI0039E5E275